jgi:hypothetical protein
MSATDIAALSLQEHCQNRQEEGGELRAMHLSLTKWMESGGSACNFVRRDTE